MSPGTLRCDIMVQDTAGCSAAPCSAMEACCDFASSNTNLESVSTNAISNGISARVPDVPYSDNLIPVVSSTNLLSLILLDSQKSLQKLNKLEWL